MHIEINRNATSPGLLNKTFNKNLKFLNTLAEDDEIPVMTKQNVEIRSFGTVKMGLSRQAIKVEECLEATYDPVAKKAYDKKMEQLMKHSHKSNLKVFGYKHPKVMKFMAMIMKCTKDCLD